MESKTNYTVVGIVVLLLAAGLLSSLLWLSVGFERKKYNTYVVYMHEPANGLSEDSLVKFNGVKVGTVGSVILSSRDPQRIKLLLNIEDGTLITTSTQATLVTQGITGTTYLGLSAASPTLTPLTPQPGKKYPIIPYRNSFFNQMEKNITDISATMKRILDKENAEHIKTTLINLEKMSETIARNDPNINKSLEELPRVLRALKLSVNQITKASQQFAKTMKVGENSLAQFTTQTVPATNTLLQRLNAVASNLEQVSQLMQQNPAVVIRGTAPAKPGPGE